MRLFTLDEAIHLLPSWLPKQFIRQFFLFSLVGVLSAGTDFGGYLVLTRGFLFLSEHYVVASVLSSVAAMGVNFWINRRWTFAARSEGVAQYVRYLSVYGASALLQSSVLWVMVEQFSLPDWLAKIIAILVIAYGWNFPLAKFWVFRYTGHTENMNSN